MAADPEKRNRLIKAYLKSIKGKNKDVIVPFEIAWARQPEMSVHEQRVLIRVMEYVSAQLKGIRISDNLRKIEPTEVTYEITMPTSDAFFSDMTPKEMKEELLVLAGRMFQYREGKRWWACGYIEHPDVDFGTGMMRFGIYKPFWEVLLNFVSGYREIELHKALLLPTTYSLRFYMLMSGKTKPLEMSVEDFKKWLGISEDLYKDAKGNHRIDHLEDRVIKPSKKALDESCPYTFTYEKIRVNPKNSRSKVTGFRFHSVYQPQFRDPELEQNSLMSKVSKSWLIGKNIYDYLVHNFGYTSETLAHHKLIIRKWEDAERESGGDPLLWLSQKRPAANRSNKGPVAYICGAMKLRTEELLNKKNTAVIAQEETEVSAQAQTPPSLFNFDDLAGDLANKFKI